MRQDTLANHLGLAGQPAHARLPIDKPSRNEDTRLMASERLVQEVAGGISASFVGPWP